VRRLKIGGTIEIVVPGGNGKRDLLSQLHYPIDTHEKKFSKKLRLNAFF
jgi:hypothetical protein